MDSTRILLYVLAVFAGLIGGVGDALLNKWAKLGGGVGYAIGGYSCWLIALTLFTAMLKRGLLAHCVILFLVANCLIVLLASVLLFHEQLSDQKWMGIVLAIAALIMIETG